MNDKRPKSFNELFDTYNASGNVYDHISERKDYLVKKLLDPSCTGLPLSRVYLLQRPTNNVLHFLDEWVKKNHIEQFITEFSDVIPSVSFKLKNGTIVFSDYICVEYFRLYLAEAGMEHLKRYIYFEIYYDDYIVTCLMDIVTFRKSGALEGLDMDAQEWAYAKMQMKFWNQAIYPETEEMELNSALLQRIKKYHNLEKSKDNWGKETDPEFAFDAGMGDIWAALAYLCSFQILERLPPKYLPQYAINFVCSSDYYCQRFSDKLTAILSDLFKDDCYINGKIPLHSEYQRSKAQISSPCSVRPYILRIQRTSSIRDLLPDINHFSNIQASKIKWAKHPFRYDVPICISDEQIVDSAVLNIRAENQMIENLSVENYPTPSLIRFFCSIRIEEDDEIKCCKRGEIQKQLDDMEKAVRTAFRDQEKCINRREQMFRLSIIFLLIHNIRFHKYELPDNIKSWFEGLLKGWQAQDATLKSAVEQVLDMVAKDAENVPTEFPKDKKDLEQNYGGICKKGNLLLYERDSLKEKISKFFSSLTAEDIVKELDEKGILKTNKDILTYSVKVDKISTKFYAFYLDKLKEVE